MRFNQVKALYYIAHISKVPSILERGILSHSMVEQLGLETNPIYNHGIVDARKNKITPDGRSLWDFANLYFQPRNPMLYRVMLEQQEDIVIIEVKPEVLLIQGTHISNGNAANTDTEILNPQKGLESIDPRILTKEFWIGEDGTKRRIMAECLVPSSVPPDLIGAIYVPNREIMVKLRLLIPDSGVSIIIEPKLFFYSNVRSEVTNLLTVVEGDMFFSGMQTITISVNTVGVMGKGVASRAKYQFPDVYVVYQDLCKQKILKMGEPYLYKRESTLDYFADEFAGKQANGNGQSTWFLLFPTKVHWKMDADFKGIEKGLVWLRDKYTREGIKSLALPALGCGLGNLKWQDVGPLMCRMLADLDIPVKIYLPAEKRVPDAQLSAEILLKKMLIQTTI